MIASISAVVPWLGTAALPITLWFLRLLFIENRKLKLDENSSDQRIRVENVRLMMELAERAGVEIARLTAELGELRSLREHALHLREAIGHIKALIAAETSEDWLSAERGAVAFLRRFDAGDGLPELPSEMEI